MEPIGWTRYGGYECSSVGDKRFSALNARLADGRTIEMHYQCDVKGYHPGGTNWRLGKGRKPLLNYPGDGLYLAYRNLWHLWAWENKSLMEELRNQALMKNGLLSDCFATTPINQARTLADLLNMGRWN